MLDTDYLRLKGIEQSVQYNQTGQREQSVISVATQSGVYKGK